MSLAIKTSRVDAMGDPGLFGAIGGALKGAVGGLLTGGPLGAIGGAISGGVAGGRGRPRAQARPGGRQRQIVMPGVGRRNIQQQQRRARVQPRPGLKGAAERFFPGGETGFEVLFAEGGGNGTGPAPSGFHWNKSAYTLMDGTHVPKGSKLVRNRRRNPGNARANSRAIARISSAKKMAKHLSRISIREKSCK